MALCTGIDGMNNNCSMVAKPQTFNIHKQTNLPRLLLTHAEGCATALSLPRFPTSPGLMSPTEMAINSTTFITCHTPTPQSLWLNYRRSCLSDHLLNYVQSQVCLWFVVNNCFSEASTMCFCFHLPLPGVVLQMSWTAGTGAFHTSHDQLNKAHRHWGQF